MECLGLIEISSSCHHDSYPAVATMILETIVPEVISGLPSLIIPEAVLEGLC
jgi:hypothetical protein